MFIPGTSFLVKRETETDQKLKTNKKESLGKKSMYKKLISVFLPLGFILASIFSRRPFSYLLTFPLRMLGAIDFIFLVYPGTLKDIVKYCPLWLAQTILFSAKPTFAGMITPGKSRQRGLYLVVPELIGNMLAERR